MMAILSPTQRHISLYLIQKLCSPYKVKKLYYSELIKLVSLITMPNDAPELLFLQGIYILALTLIIRHRLKHGHTAVLYWIIATVYLFVAIYLVKEYIMMPAVGEGGTWFAIEMYAMIVPGILVGVALIVFFISSEVRSFRAMK
jgi:hypothetical protein